jgi:hypothetical protein
MKRWLGFVMAAALVLGMAGQAWAEHGGGCCAHGGQCQMMAKRGYDHDGGKGGCDCPIQSKILKKAGFLLENAEAIGLSDDQVAQIKAIKMDTKKAKIRMGAEMKMMELDLDAKMSEAKLDVEGLNAMIDTAAQGFNAGSKASIATYAKLRGILSEEQQVKAKALWKKQN